MRRGRSVVSWCGVGTLVLVAAASGQAWTEAGDAPSFPDGIAQLTRGTELTTITGSTSGTDLRDAYCVRIVAASVFAATTDSNTDPAASTSFDSRLFLFDAGGRPVLANDDTPAGGPASTITAASSDGSGYDLETNTNYVLVIAGDDALPQDGTMTPVGLFDVDSDADAVHARAGSAGRFDAWSGGAAEFGAYTIALSGAVPCLDEPGIVFARSGEASRLCRGDGAGGLLFCEAGPEGTTASAAVALDNVGGDAVQDAVFANTGELSQSCSGTSAGLVFCANIAATSVNATEIALAHVDGDDALDLVLANDDNTIVCLGDGGGLFLLGCSQVADNPTFSDSTDVAVGYLDTDARLDFVLSTDGEDNRVCLSNVVGGGFAFPACSSVSGDNDASQGVAVGRVDGDSHPDVVFANSGAPNQVCLGDGAGGFTCSEVEPSPFDARDVALGDLDGDGQLDAVFAAGSGDHDRVCLGSGDGLFSCADVSAATDVHVGVAIAHLDADDHPDLVFGGGAEQLCLGDGSGGFSCSDVLPGGTTASTDVAAGRRVESSIFLDGFESGGTSAW